MTTSKTGLLKGTTIELEGPVPELDGKRVRVVLESIEDLHLAAEQQRELWLSWIENGPQGPIDDAPDTDLP